MKSFRLKNKKEVKEKKKNSTFSWVLSEEELKNQLDIYDGSVIHKPYRKISCIVTLWFVISAILAISGLLGDLITPFEAILAIIIYSLLLYFVYKGHRWSIILLMIIFTIEVINKEIEALQFLNKARVYPFVLWLIIMPSLYKDLKVEIAMKKIKKEEKKKKDKN